MSLSELFFGFKAQTKVEHSEFFKSDDVNPWDRTRTTPMQVLCLGLARTGTASMAAALTELGYKTYHGYQVIADIQDYDLWNAAYQTKYLAKPSSACPVVDKAFLDMALGHMNAVTDMPAASFPEELISAYPEAKVILVERDIAAWEASFTRVFVDIYESWSFAAIAWLNPTRVGRAKKFVESVAHCHFQASDGKEFKENLRPVYREHYQKIRRLLEQRGESDTRLLEFNLDSGWKPLCGFLEKEIPKDVPFPRVNEARMMQLRINILLIRGLRKSIGEALMVLIPLLMLIMGWMLQSKLATLYGKSSV